MPPAPGGGPGHREASLMQTRAFIRTASIVLLTAIALGLDGSDIMLPWHPFSTYGFSAAPSGVVTSVDADAARAGLHVSDKIALKALQPAERGRIGFLSPAPEGSVMRLPLVTGRIVTLTSHVYTRSPVDNITDVIATVCTVGYLVIAAALVLLRPTPATWAFYAFAFNVTLSGVLFFEYAPLALTLPIFVLGNVAAAASPIGFVSFAMRFPDEQPKGVLQAIERVLLFGVFPVAALVGIAATTAYIFAATSLPQQVNTVETAVTFALFALGVAILVGRYAHADQENRTRLRWIVAAFGVAFLPGLATGAVIGGLSISPPLWMLNAALAWQVLAPIALAYTILRHRLFDIRFVISRALVFGVMTSAVIGIMALVDWGLGRWLAEWRFALVAELGLALLLGVSLTTIHRRIEAALNNVIFRAQVLAMRALHRFALEIDLIADPKRLVSQTFEALRARVDCDYIAIYTADGSSYALATPTSGESTPSLLPNDDFAVLRLRRWSEPFECDEPAHPLRGALLLPMTARAQLVGFIVCGPKRDRTRYLPDEVETLAALAHRAGAAYAWLTFRSPTSEGFDSLQALREPS